MIFFLKKEDFLYYKEQSQVYFQYVILYSGLNRRES